MNDVEKFVAHWSGRGYEKGEMQPFWLSFLRDVLEISEPEKFIRFEVPVKLKHTSFIDAFLPDAKVIIEQKSLSENLSQEKFQSDGTTLTPYEQAQRYGSSLPYSMRPRWIVVCNFAEFLIYDMETLAKHTKILLSELPEKFHVFDFLIDHTKNKLRVELELSLKAGEIVGKLYDALHSQYLNPDNAESLISLNKLCVRLVFCLYAESAGIFGKHKIFRDFLAEEKNIRRALMDLFDVINTPVNERDPYLDDTLKKFPFVNGGLFSGSIEIPNFTPDIKNLLLEEASSGFNWAGISPTIFGAVFESTLNPVTRRAAGMHYTSLENIHKVIDPLFLDDLRNELQTIKQSARNRKKNLLAFQDKLASLKIFDPACGSGNFLTESYLSLRRLENDVLKELFGSQIQLGEFINPIKISIGQFFGIEINDFAVAVAQTALWIAELQMIQETQEIIHHDLDFLPLKSYANIHEGNALKLDWKEICPQPNFIIGNPPFVGFKFASKSQKEDMQFVFKNSIKPALLDYVCCWYKKAADFIQGTNIEVTFVSTNSVSQGKMAGDLWSLLLESVTINFAWQSFIWDSESIQKAHVHCVVIGFAAQPRDKKILYSGERKSVVENISPYLIDSPNILVTTRNKPLHDVPEIIMGNQAMDGGNLIIEAADYENFIAKEPLALPYIKRYMMGNEFINGKLRWCLWLVNCPPNKLRKMPLVLKRVEAVKNFRAASKDPGARKKAKTPTLFREQRNPKNFIAIPITSSERRKYIPIGYLDDSIIAGNTVFIIPDATIYHFGVLTSSVHMAWMRTVGERLKSDYRYSKDIVYNNFPWPEPSSAQRRAVETAAQKILYVRKNYPDATLADLYDPLTMPKDLRDAHKKNDSAVAAAYGLENLLNDEPMIVAELLKLYKKLSE